MQKLYNLFPPKHDDQLLEVWDRVHHFFLFFNDIKKYREFWFKNPLVKKHEHKNLFKMTAILEDRLTPGRVEISNYLTT